MLSKQGSRSSLRASLKVLFPSKSQTSLCLDNGDVQNSTTDHEKAVQTDPDLSGIWTNDIEVTKRKDTRTSEDGVSITSRDAFSRNESRDADLSLYSRSRDTSFIDESKDAGLNQSGYPDTMDEGKLAKDCKSEADTLSVTGTIDSRIDDLSPVKAKPCCECSGPLGMEGGIISNQQITASSTQRAVLGMQKWYPYFARLNRKGLVNAWTAAENDRWPWIQVNLLRRMRITGVITQGAKRMGKPEYVKSYRVAFSQDGERWSMYIDRGTRQDMEFLGNVDNNTPSANSFTPPIEAQFIRIYPQVCRGHCTLRIELLGCELTGCSEPMGMKTGHIQDFQISSSSSFQTLNMDAFSWAPGKARLDKPGKVNAWASAANDQSQWLQVDMLLPTKVTGIITQGSKYFGHVQFVGSYKLAFSSDGEKWIVYQDESQQKDKIFQGNFDNETHRKNAIDPPIYARFIRIIPWSWYGRIALRTELLGCTEEEE
ncbi:EGF-like repeat and discoidin I-like domain-containing protein 3 isoform X1 [Alosa alosa]|uniref:EGF-like repeat and discoidin I-like domain-containing protein 3 isoform X1 n=1 Tax=Alosa alosa TaxID=278164 RepID=UPI00201541E7|nr:EGF-like repeat and discoidin I-like domain-containing protein 3 isoform X1 [Alosa alosa]